MSRKRSSRKTYKPEAKPKLVPKLKTKIKSNKRIYTVIMLVAIFCLVMFLNSYFNYTSGVAFNPDGTTLGTRFYLSGPDPYYNMRTCEVMLERGTYPFIQGQEHDPLVNYPVGQRWSRPPLFNSIAVMSTNILSNFMPQMDALGWSMLFLPAIYGALLILPVYGIGKELFNRKVGLIAALFIAIIPIHLSAGHGSSLSLFDHDSFLSLLFITSFYFIIKGMKTPHLKPALIYSSLGGIFIASIYLTWTASRYVFMLLLIYMIVQFLFNLFKFKCDIKVPLLITTTSITAFFISLPYAVLTNDIFSYPLICVIGCITITSVTYLINKYKAPWTITVPLLGGAGIVSLLLLNFLYVKNALGGTLLQISTYIFKYGLYGDKISWTIAEAGNLGISTTVMSFGPALYWIGLAGFVLYVYKTHKENWLPANLFFLVIFIMNMYLTANAGRFMNDFLPPLAICAAYLTERIVAKTDIKQMFKNIKQYNITRFYRAINMKQITGITVILFLILLPNSFLALDAAVPPVMKEEVFGSGYQGAFGLSLGKSYYWSDACYWLSQQDTEIQNYEDRPGFISWWDYGFYELSMGNHPTVADNYQSGIPAASNFKLSQTESEAVSVLLIRLCEGSRDCITLVLPVPVKQTIIDHLGSNATKMISYIEQPTTCPSYDTIIAPEYGNTELRVTPDNAMYHDCVDLIVANLDDEQITQFYMDIQETTGYSIRYYGTESYDTHIFTVFTLLSDRGTHGYITPDDDYLQTVYKDSSENIYTISMLQNLSQSQFDELGITTSREYKQPYYDSMWYRTYHGIRDNRMPTYMLKHWKPVYMSPYVIISKYYEGAKISGYANVGNSTYQDVTIVLFDEYQIPHDIVQTNSFGRYDILAPAGNLTLSLFSGDQRLQDISLNVSEQQALRKTDYRELNIFHIDHASLNCTVDTNQTELVLHINNVVQNLTTGNNTHHMTLVPRYYDIHITNSTGSYLYSDYVFLKPGENDILIKI